ncbi:MAG: glycosyltransferase family 4 protein [Acidothermus sp.]|nr:glycosyltransferase family 4 protein [Acidothermus sp.]
MKVALDATPLLGTRTGVGRYVAHITEALSEIDAVDLTLTAFTWRGRLRRTPEIPRGARIRSPRVPARLVRAMWTRFDVPPVELFCGAVEIFHGTNFVLPPRLRAAGIVTIHDLAFVLHPDTVDAASRAYQVLVPRALRRADIVITPSQATADDLCRVYGYPPERVAVTPLGVDRAWTTARPLDAAARAAYRVPERYFLFVGTLEPRKNLSDLLLAHRQLCATAHDAPPLVVVGPEGWGGVHVPTEDLATGRVIRLGFLPHEVLRALTAGATALVMPSRYEGFGLPALEALACGTPVVASDVPALREVTGGLARYFPVGDPEALADALRHAEHDREDRDAEARRRAWATEFTWERCAHLTIEAYRRALDGRRRSKTQASTETNRRPKRAAIFANTRRKPPV